MSTSDDNTYFAEQQQSPNAPVETASPTTVDEYNSFLYSQQQHVESQQQAPPYYYAQQQTSQYDYQPTERLVDPNATSSSSPKQLAAAQSRKPRAPSTSEPGGGPFFNPTKQLCNLYSVDRSTQYAVRLNPRIDRGFFLSDNDWTCYRRNYFQLSISYTATDSTGNRIELPCLVELEGRGLRTVTEFLIGVMARTSNGSREIVLVQHTAKRDKGPQAIPMPKSCQSQDPAVAYGLGTPESDDTNTIVFERLQFKSATANNGKRRAAQQYHVVFAELLARCDDGCVARVASTESAPLVVRGRAPGHYANIKDQSVIDTAIPQSHTQVSPKDTISYSDASVQEYSPQTQEYPDTQSAGQHQAPNHNHMAYTAYTAPESGGAPPHHRTWNGEYYQHHHPVAANSYYPTNVWVDPNTGMGNIDTEGADHQVGSGSGEAFDPEIVAFVGSVAAYDAVGTASLLDISASDDSITMPVTPVSPSRKRKADVIEASWTELRT